MKRLWFLALASTIFFFSPGIVQAQETPKHTTLIINQVRGRECCSEGGINELKLQLQLLQDTKLSAGFAVRYDALGDPQFTSLLKQAQRSGHEMGAFLEITPQLAKDAGVEYEGPLEHWYEARNAYTIGYAPEDRPKLIEAYMKRYESVFKSRPKFSVGWIVDTPTLKLLHETYGVELHEITREQWGTDSYTLYGGPPHLPYWPSENWALIPSTVPTNMPLIIRQTIADPVWNYGDTTNSRTSQPNDYALKERGFPYFEHLFSQAHSQPFDQRTFALIGLENSMPDRDQKEFGKQLESIRHWLDNGPNRNVLIPSAYALVDKAYQQPELSVVAGKDDKDSTSQAWWITSSSYRARVRKEGDRLSLTDIRLYDRSLTDPYTSTSAGRIAYWVAPFVIDGSRFLSGDSAVEFLRVAPDNLQDRTPGLHTPTNIQILGSSDVQLEREGESVRFTSNGQTLATFSPEGFALRETTRSLHQPLLNRVIKDLIWNSASGKELWGVKTKKDGTLIKYTPFFQATAEEIALERQERYPLLIPEAKERPIDQEASELYRNNQYAQAGRNPVRLVLFPRDKAGFPVMTSSDPVLSAQPKVDKMRFERPHGQNGMIFIDFLQEKPGKSIITIELDGFKESLPIYFAPNCKTQLMWCATHPWQIPWYLKNWWADKQRAQEEARKAAQFR